MGTEVLRPQDALTQRIGVAPAIFHRRKNYYGNGYGSPKGNSSNRKPAVRSDQRRRSPESRSASDDESRTKQVHNNSLVLGKVTILKRGESLDTKIKANQKNNPNQKSNMGEMIVYGTERLGPDPKMVPKQVRMVLPDMYAGSAFSMSPAPSSLPLPTSFFNKKDGSKTVDDSATRDLRRLLRLD